MATDAKTERAAINRLFDHEKFKIAGAFQQNKGIDFKGWPECIQWVFDQTGIRCTRPNLVVLRKSAELEFTVRKNVSNGPMKSKQLFRLISQLEDRVAELETEVERLKRGEKTLFPKA